MNRSPLQLYSKVCDWIEKVSEYICIVLVGILALSVISGVLLRNISIPVVWLGELGTFSSVWVTFLGLGLAYRQGMYPNVDLLAHVVPSKYKPWFELFWSLVGAVISGIIVFSARSFMMYLLQNGHRSGELRIPYFYIYCGPIVGLVILFLFTAEAFGKNLAKIQGQAKLSIKSEVQA